MDVGLHLTELGADRGRGMRIQWRLAFSCDFSPSPPVPLSLVYVHLS